MFPDVSATISRVASARRNAIKAFTLYMGELQASFNSFSMWQAVLWCYYPMAVLVALELLARSIDDDDDQDGGKMVPALQNYSA